MFILFIVTSCSAETYSIKHLECLPNLVLRILVVDFDGHHHEELWEVDHAGAVLVHLRDHVLDHGLARVLAERSQDGANLGGAARSTVIAKPE